MIGLLFGLRRVGCGFKGLCFDVICGCFDLGFCLRCCFGYILWAFVVLFMGFGLVMLVCCMFWRLGNFLMFWVLMVLVAFLLDWLIWFCVQISLFDVLDEASW